MKRLVKHRFTLAELLVSMAVFSMLLLIMMQFFSGARTLWTANEKRSAIYADATVAMDLMSKLLQSTVYNCDSGTPFAITGGQTVNALGKPEPLKRPDTISDTDNGTDGWNSKIYFLSNSPLELSKGGSVRYLSFQRKTDTNVSGVSRNVLEIWVFSDSSDTELKFDQCFTPYGDIVPNDTPIDKYSQLAKANEYLDRVFNGELSSKFKDNEKKVVLRNVTGLKFTPVDHTGIPIYGATFNNLPAGIEIELSLMENEQTIRDYQALETKDLRNEFRLKNEYTFRRTIWLGDRTVSL